MTPSDAILMFGSARWGRILGRILLQQTDCSLQFVTASAERSSSLMEWASSLGHAGRVTVVSSTSEATAAARAVFVANAARDHEAAALFALSRNLPVLVEKPLALTGDVAERLIGAARSSGGTLALSNVFRFAEYMEAFREEFARRRDWSAVRVVWTDPAQEERHGAAKTYDASVPVFVDVLPHVVSIMDWLIPGAPLSVNDLTIENGGQVVRIALLFDGRPCDIELGRNRDRRRRLVEFTTSDGLLSLDFAEEPGVTRLGDRVLAERGTPQQPGPLARQALAFLAHPEDPRLSPEVGVRTCCIVDGLLPRYLRQRELWLQDVESGVRTSLEVDVQYARRERDG